MDPQVNNDQNNKINPNLLSSVGLFIKDHGIAIFLVVFFVIWIYPEQAKERKDWITQLTKLQEALDPTKRSISQEQANVILDLTLESFIQSIEINMNQQGFNINHINRSYITNDFYDVGNKKAIRIFGQEYQVDPSDQKNKEAVLNAILKKYLRFSSQSKIYSMQEAKSALDKSIKSAQYLTGGLSSFRYMDTNLAELWLSAFNTHYPQMGEKLMNAFSSQRDSSYERDLLISFYENLDMPVPEALATSNSAPPASQMLLELREAMRNDWSKKIKQYNVIEY